MAQVMLEVEARKDSGKGFARRLRSAGMVPAVVYGKEMETTKVAVEPKALYQAVSGEAGWNTLITLKGAGLDNRVVVLRDASIHPIRRDMLCADFHAIDLKQKGYFMVPVHVVGKSAGEKAGGSLQLIRKELEVVCLPTEVPQSIEIDVKDLEIGDTVHIEDVVAPAGVELEFEVNFTVITVVGQSAEEEEDTDEAAEEETDED